jgi:hypothetical protein
MKLKDTPVNGGGLMRCCTDTISQMFVANPEQEMVEGQQIECIHEKKISMEVKNGIIAWIGYERSKEMWAGR